MRLTIPMVSRTWTTNILLAIHAITCSSSSNFYFCDESRVFASENFLAVAKGHKEMVKGESVDAAKRTLRGIDLRRAIAGKKITPDISAGQRAVDFTEFFHADGKWMSARRERTLTQTSGTWSVSGSKICVKIDGTRQGICREFWFSSNPSRAFSYDLDTGPLKSGLISFIVEPVG